MNQPFNVHQDPPFQFRQQSTDGSRRRPADSVQTDGDLLSRSPRATPVRRVQRGASARGAAFIDSTGIQRIMSGIYQLTIKYQESQATSSSSKYQWQRAFSVASETGLPDRTALGTAFPSPLIRGSDRGHPRGLRVWQRAPLHQR